MKLSDDPIKPIVCSIFDRCRYVVEVTCYEKIAAKVWNYGSVTLPIRALIKTEINEAVKRINENKNFRS
jgi:hypothetical protein